MLGIKNAEVLLAEGLGRVPPIIYLISTQLAELAELTSAFVDTALELAERQTLPAIPICNLTMSSGSVGKEICKTSLVVCMYPHLEFGGSIRIH